MNTQVVGGVRAVEVAPQRKEIKYRYMEALTLIERLHRRLLDVIKDDFERSGKPAGTIRVPMLLTISRNLLNPVM